MKKTSAARKKTPAPPKKKASAPKKKASAPKRPKLDRAAIEEAARAVSAGGKLPFTARQLYYELLRRGAELAPGPDVEKVIEPILATALRGKKALVGLVRPEKYVERLAARPEADVFDYAVRRAIVFDRIELMLLFALSGFHRKLEIALLTLDGAPRHVWKAMERQLADNVKTRFYLLHDCDARGFAMKKAFEKRVAKRRAAEIVDLGIDFAHAMRTGIPVRRVKAAGARVPKGSGGTGQARRLIAAGNYAHLEELAPLALLRWVYPRVARGAADVGFG